MVGLLSQDGNRRAEIGPGKSTSVWDIIVSLFVGRRKLGKGGKMGRKAQRFFIGGTLFILLFGTCAAANRARGHADERASLALVASVAGTADKQASPANFQAREGPARQSDAADEAKGVKAYTLPPDLYEKAVKFSRAEYLLYFVDVVYGLIVLILVLSWRLAPKYRDWAERASSKRFLQAAIFTPLLLVTMSLLMLPVEIYGHWLVRTYGLSVQGWKSWAWDRTKLQLLFCVFGILLTSLLFGVIRRSARRWWFYFWLASLPILLFVFFISPVAIDPLFHKFEPLEAKDPKLVTLLEDVVQRGGMSIPAERMYWMQASEKSTALNAYVTGVGASKRVVVWDTTIARMSAPQIAFVFGHEMGHYVLGHIPKSLAFFAAVLFVFLYLGYRSMLWALGRWGGRWHIRGAEDWASLPVLLVVLSIFVFLADPITNSYSRAIEHQADVYGLEVTHGLESDSSQVAAQAFQILGEVDLADPHPNAFIKVWLYSHPPIDERVRFALTYDPWEKGDQLQFVK
jgi:Zn-dependent protease with chaperone function